MEKPADGPKEKFNHKELLAKIKDEARNIAIPTNYLNKEGRLLAYPGGPLSKLRPEEWRAVRTSSFKNWFGDWENNLSNSSKMVDENGEPRRFTHMSVYAIEHAVEPNKEFRKDISRFLHVASEWGGTFPAPKFGHGIFIHDAFASIKNPLVIEGSHYSYGDKVGEISNIDDDFLEYLVKNNYDGVYSPDLYNLKGQPYKKPFTYLDELTPLYPHEQLLFIRTPGEHYVRRKTP